MTAVDRKSGDGAAGETGKRQLPLWQEAGLLLGIALVLAIIIKSFFVQAFYIPSESMEPQFIDNDRILVQKVSYWGSGTPQRGDIVVFKDPGGWLPGEGGASNHSPLVKVLQAIGLYPSGNHLVKRVIGVGGDHVVCCDREGRITVNGKALNETSYLPKGTSPGEGAGQPEERFNVHVPANHLWVMGDNRGDSADSRAHMGTAGGGFVADDLVVGRVFALVWPLDRAEIIHRPSTFSHIPDH